MGRGLAETLAHFVRQSLDCGVVEIRRQRRRFIASLAFNLLLLALDVAAVLGLDIHLQADLFG